MGVAKGKDRDMNRVEMENGIRQRENQRERTDKERMCVCVRERREGSEVKD